MTEYSIRSLSIEDVSVESITVYGDQDTVKGIHLGIHVNSILHDSQIDSIQHQIKTAPPVKAILRSELGVFEGTLIDLKRLRGMYVEDVATPVFFMYISFESCLSTNATKIIIASRLDPDTLVLEIPSCMCRVEAW